MKSKSLSLAAIVLLASFSLAKAQVFTNDALTANGSNIETAGPVLFAYNFDYNSTSATVNGINFVGINLTNGSTSFFSINGGGMDGTGGGDSGDTAAVQTLNENGVYGGSTYVLKGLTSGVTYAAQFIFDADGIDNRYVALKDESATSATVTGGIPGPQYITDTFVASSATETLTRADDGGLQLSGIVVETLPEPGTWALMSLGLVGLAAFHRLRFARS
jgi:hypothetical protein